MKRKDKRTKNPSVALSYMKIIDIYKQLTTQRRENRV
jgi:hypothetical protein